MTVEVVRPSAVAAAQAARLEELDAAADRYVSTQRPRTTRAAYAQDWSAWEDYAAWAGIPVLSGSRGASGPEAVQHDGSRSSGSAALCRHRSTWRM